MPGPSLAVFWPQGEARHRPRSRALHPEDVVEHRILPGAPRRKARARLRPARLVSGWRPLNVVPFPMTLSTRTKPPCCFASSWTRASPIPVPSKLRPRAPRRHDKSGQRFLAARLPESLCRCRSRRDGCGPWPHAGERRSGQGELEGIRHQVQHDLFPLRSIDIDRFGDGRAVLVANQLAGLAPPRTNRRKRHPESRLVPSVAAPHWDSLVQGKWNPDSRISRIICPWTSSLGPIHLLLVETSLHREAGTRTTGASLADVGRLDNRLTTDDCARDQRGSRRRVPLNDVLISGHQ
jgi:hypothetical protein